MKATSPYLQWTIVFGARMLYGEVFSMLLKASNSEPSISVPGKDGAVKVVRPPPGGV